MRFDEFLGREAITEWLNILYNSRYFRALQDVACRSAGRRCCYRFSPLFSLLLIQAPANFGLWVISQYFSFDIKEPFIQRARYTHSTFKTRRKAESFTSHVAYSLVASRKRLGTWLSSNNGYLLLGANL